MSPFNELVYMQETQQDKAREVEQADEETTGIFRVSGEVLIIIIVWEL